ncbi:MAG: tetratricopeptide repeat protein [Chloroflexi bacterium]|nr:tetratricopeptide repeat protein [Chloroflexota bacterium]
MNTHRASRLLSFLTIFLIALSACAPDVVRHNETGNEHFDENVYDDAVSEYRLAQVDEPDLAEPYYNAANAYNRMSQVDAALAQTDQALKTADPELAAQAWYNLGNAFFDAEQWPQAIEAYKEALRFQSDDLDAKHNLELALQKLEEQQQEQEQDEQQQEQDEQSKDEQEEQQEQEQQDEQQQEQEPESSEGQEEQQETSEPSGEPQEGSEGMTEEQAIQLLQALLNESQTLQERLQEIHQAPGSAPEQDW